MGKHLQSSPPLSSMSASNDDLDFSLDSVFPEPPRPPTPEPTIAEYTRDVRKNALTGGEVSNAEDWSKIEIRLVGTHPLWGHYLWNAARAFASYLDSNPQLYINRTVLELGAGGGLPGLVTIKNGARKVILTDYPDADLIQNMEYNVMKNIPSNLRDRISVQGYIWGHTVKPLLDALGPTSSTSSSGGFDLLILSDLIFNHSQHDALLKTCELTLAPISASTPSGSGNPPRIDQQVDTTPSVLVFFTHHRPHLAHRDMEFFTKAREQGWECDMVVTQKFLPMFPDDPGEEDVRSTVHGWRLRRQSPR